MLWVTVHLGIVILTFIFGIGNDSEGRFDNTGGRIKWATLNRGRDFIWLPDDAPEELLERDDVLVYPAGSADELCEELGVDVPGER